MDIFSHGLAITIHEWVAVFFIALAIALFGLVSVTAAGHRMTVREYRAFGFYLVAMAVLAWVSVAIGAYWAYPFYRAVPPEGTIDLHQFPQRLLISNPATARWHAIGMEWKEHVAWFAPIAFTAAASLFLRYGARLAQLRSLRNATVALAVTGFVAATIAATSGAMIRSFAPVRDAAPSTLLGGHHD